ncbi:hypothetical protein C0Q70_10012 [Pomacea canaliculata]|uniref:Uncharacterized protein n=1 Tax=Pomacea canaliculata TaxID=400727 RepID=A0A2T7PBD9_POMCA|nr:hypothetical protein C0Q70_10012 [Pomacea canaliculata]
MEFAQVQGPVAHWGNNEAGQSLAKRAQCMNTTHKESDKRCPLLNEIHLGIGHRRSQLRAVAD